MHKITSRNRFTWQIKGPKTVLNEFGSHCKNDLVFMDYGSQSHSNSKKIGHGHIMTDFCRENVHQIIQYERWLWKGSCLDGSTLKIIQNHPFSIFLKHLISVKFFRKLMYSSLPRYIFKRQTFSFASIYGTISLVDFSQMGKGIVYRFRVNLGSVNRIHDLWGLETDKY